MIDQATIDKVFDAADIVEVVQDYVTLKKRGVNYIGLCPFHNEKTPSFTVSPAKNICKCFGCGKGGNPVNFIMELENLSYIDAIKHLARKYNIQIEEKELSAEDLQRKNERESLISVTEWLSKHFVSNLKNNDEGRAVGLSYFRHRGFRDDIIERFQLGYAVNVRDYYTKEAIKNGYKLEYLDKIGATIIKEDGYTLDRFRGRAIFPIHSISGKVIAFGGRAIKKDDAVKYQNSPESEVYHKSEALYGIFFAKNHIIRKQKCYIVEGYADVISMVQAGVENIVAPCGTALTVDQIRLLKRILPSVGSDADYSNKNVTLLYDGDSAGMNAALKNGKLLLAEGINVRVVVLPPEDDPDTFAQSHSPAEVEAYLNENEQDYIIFKLSHSLPSVKGDPIKKSELIKEMALTIAAIPDKIKRAVYVKDCAARLQSEERLFYSVINKQIKDRRDRDMAMENAPKRENVQAASPDEPPADLFMPGDGPSVGQVTYDYDAEERNILMYMLKYGNVALCAVEDIDEGGNTYVRDMSVLEYVVNSLSHDELSFFNPMHKKIYDEMERHVGETDFLPERFFMSSPLFQDCSGLIVDLLAEKYPLSRIFFDVEKEMEVVDVVFADENGVPLSMDERIEREKEMRVQRQEEMARIASEKEKAETVERLFELVPHVVMDFKYKVTTRKLEEIRSAMKVETDMEKTMQLMQELMVWQKVHLALSKELGERIVIKM